MMEGSSGWNVSTGWTDTILPDALDTTRSSATKGVMAIRVTSMSASSHTAERDLAGRGRLRDGVDLRLPLPDDLQRLGGGARGEGLGHQRGPR